ncbi:MAG: 30S ribosomal protein S16 [Candidatus Omnitrophica bacterium]|nr:30S ribosomal protein S16 [Candidatus Omnitrophota bacterium]MDD5437034.1 30S ribosomal protein S16 [Candidatus Omnitrophota bacterium]
MPAVIRLKRMGTLKKPFHRIIVIDKRRARDSRPIEILGFYDPKTDPATVKVKKERAEYWLGVGAAPSPIVRTLLKKQGIKASKK